MTDDILRHQEEQLGAAIVRALLLLDAYQPSLENRPRPPRQIAIKSAPAAIRQPAAWRAN